MKVKERDGCLNAKLITMSTSGQNEGVLYTRRVHRQSMPTHIVNETTRAGGGCLQTPVAYPHSLLSISPPAHTTEQTYPPCCSATNRCDSNWATPHTTTAHSLHHCQRHNPKAQHDTQTARALANALRTTHACAHTRPLLARHRGLKPTPYNQEGTCMCA